MLKKIICYFIALIALTGSAFAQVAGGGQSTATVYSGIQPPIFAYNPSVRGSGTTATIAAVAGKTAYLSGFEVTGGGATAGTITTLQVSGLLGGTINYAVPVPAGVTTGVTPLVVEFNPPIPASAVNTQIALFLGAFGSGNTFEIITAHGFYQ